MKIYYEKDAKLSDLKGKTIGIIGYGAQGRAQALNLRDSGLKVMVGQRPGGENYKKAVQDKFKPVSASDVAKEADLINVLVQDHLQASLYQSDIKQHLKKGKSLVFSHGFNIHYKQILPPKEVDVFMVAPKAPGSLVRIQYEEGRGVPSLIAIHQNASKKALRYALAYAKGIGSTKAGVIQTTFRDETETDLFGEQSVLCGGASELITAGFETLVNAGYPAELAYFECLHELKLIVDIVYNKGLSAMRHDISDTAEYGDYSRGKRVITAQTRQAMKQILKEIQSGKFAKEWIEENRKGRPNYNRMRAAAAKHPIEKVGKRLRGMMSWVK